MLKKVAGIITFFSLILSNFSMLNISAYPDTLAKSAILMNMNTGTVLYEKNPLDERAIASTTKIMTALLTAEAGDLDKEFRVDNHAILIEGTTMGLQTDDIVTRRALLYGMLLPSGNDAANAAAVSVSGSIKNFVEEMNKKAKKIGMNNTFFVNPSGLDADGHFSTAYDMALLTAEALKNPVFREICIMESAETMFGNPPYRRWLSNNNKLLHMYEGCIGVKTGFTDNARRCLVSAVEKNGATLIAVTLNDPDDWNDHMKMFDYGFSLIEGKKIDFDLEGLTIDVIGGTKRNIEVAFNTLPEISLTDDEMLYLESEVVIKPFIYSGFEKGENIGSVNFYVNGNLVHSAALVTADGDLPSEQKLSIFSNFFRFIKKILG